MAATQIQIDQQIRILQQTQTDVRTFLIDAANLQQRLDSYNRLGFSDDAILSAAACAALGITAAQYRAAIVSITATLALLPQGHGTNLESFAR